MTSGNRTDGPWTYTAHAGASVADTWNTKYSQGVTDLTVHGPNGFLRSFRSPGKTAGPEVTIRHNASAKALELTLTHAGSGTVRLTLRSAGAYGGEVRTIAVRAGESVKHTLDLRRSKRWYDVTVTGDADDTFLRRFAGHVETGEPGVSDPGLRTG